MEVLKEINDQDLTIGSLPVRQRLIKNMRLYLKNIPDGEKVERSLDMESCDKLGGFVDRIAYHFDLPASKMQEFLEEQDVQKRANTLHSMIELKTQLIKISKEMKEGGIDFSMN